MAFLPDNILTLAYDEVMSLVTRAEQEIPDLKPVRLSLLRNITLEPMLPYLKLFCLKAGLKPEIYLGDFDTVMPEILNADSGLYRFKPDIVFVSLKLEELSAALTQKFLSLSPETLEEEMTQVEQTFHTLITHLRSNSRATLVINNFEPPLHPALGILDATASHGQQAVIARLNKNLAALAQNETNVFIEDMGRLLTQLGADAYYDHRYWHLARSPYSREALKLLALDYSKIIKALCGKTRKCLVLDADNTLWGGVVGEDGLGKIRLGGTYPGSCYAAFQQEILNLSHRGVILALNSKNNEADIKEVLAKHPERVLTEEHFASLKANWQDKVTNLKEIAAELNIGLDHMVFVDDNPFETQMVKQLLPEVEVITLPEQPEKFVSALYAGGHFDTLTHTDEDRQRGSLYKSEARRQATRREFTDLKDYYRSLEMVVTVSAAASDQADRIAQLTQRTNQFNLTTRRYSETEILEFLSSQRHDLLTLHLRDKFGDYGMIGLALLAHEPAETIIDTFLLSCRALGRHVEDVLLNTCAARALKRSERQQLKGLYFPTAKNAQVQSFYAARNFKPNGLPNAFTAEALTIAESPLPDHFQEIRRNF